MITNGNRTSVRIPNVAGSGGLQLEIKTDLELLRVTNHWMANDIALPDNQFLRNFSGSVATRFVLPSASGSYAGGLTTAHFGIPGSSYSNSAYSAVLRRPDAFAVGRY